jgi:parallel beta-helix repeat protein
VRPRHAALAIALTWAAVAAAASARTVTVPDDFPTIQVAVDSMGTSWHPDTILVRAGRYPERLVVSGQHIVVQGIPPLDGADELPEIEGMQAGGGEASGRYHFIDLHFTGAVTVGLSDDDFGFAGCRLDAGLSTAGEASVIWLFKCTSLQDVQIVAEDGHLDSCTVHGSAVIDAPYQAHVYGNRFENSSGSAVVIRSENVTASHNRVRGGDHAFDVYTETAFAFEGNDIEGCRGWGVLLESRDSEPVHVMENRIVDCGGFGLKAHGVIEARDNRIIGCQGTGLELVQDYDNGIVEGNVVGRCGDTGIRVTNGCVVEGNTIFECRGPGIAVSGSAGSVLRDNIVYNTFGLSVAGEPPVLTGNDWFPAFGVTPSATDFSVDPRFCDLATDDVRLMSDSPLLDVPGHLRIGALGQGCEPPPLAIGFEISPRVLQRVTRTRWLTAWLEPPATFPVSEIDVASVRVNDVPVAPGTDVVVTDHDGDRVPELQLRFDRAALEQTLGTGDVATFTLTGRIGKRVLSGADTIRVLRHGDPRSSAPRPWVLSIQGPRLGAATRGLEVAFTLPDATRARLDVLDVAGRVIASSEVGGREPGEHMLELAGRGGLAPGIYFLRLRQGTNEAHTRVAVLR